MVSKKKTLNKVAFGILLVTLSLLTVAVMTNGRAFRSSDEAIESFYGKAIFGGKFAWMDNIKRPGLSTTRLTKPLEFDFELSNAVTTSVNPNQDMQLIASIIDPSYNSGFRGPFDNEMGNGDLFSIEKAFVGPMDFDSGYNYGLGDSDGGGVGDSFIDNDNPPIVGDDENPEEPVIDDGGNNEVVVPLPGSVSLALIGLIALCKRRKS